jgi:hypothetical protein
MRPAAPGEVTAAGYAPLDAPGPPLDVPDSVLAASLRCSANLVEARQEAVLLVPATTATPRENYGWNYVPALDVQRIPNCAVTLPEHGMGDIQIAAEYVVYAIRRINAVTGRKVQVIGHSQGGLEPRWALRFWPDVRQRVDHYVAFAPPNHGSILVDALCVPDCAPALWQQRYGSHLTEAMNSYAETFPEVSYTVVYTHFDDFVQPNLDETGTSSLRGPSANLRNIAIQDVCPNDAADHVSLGTYDAVAYALAMDALTHAGPADPRRIDRSVCSQPFMPGVTPGTFATDYADAYSTLANQMATAAHVLAEPPLRCYVFRRCGR